MSWPTLSRFDLDVDPLGQVTAIREIFDRMTEPRRFQREFPLLNVWQHGDECVVTAEVPGVDPSKVSVAVNGDVLTIEGEREPDKLGEDDVYHCRERGCGRFARGVRLPFEVEGGSVKATYARGILRVSLPRKECTKPKRIAVETSD